ncbi:hypothetical protein [Streptomyces sp. NPDC101150]|uniref:hypothetical protein n=1 Tax=Streptomyces sp. NPDC101150 TaxID=3366114 RepID=UPI00382C6F34
MHPTPSSAPVVPERAAWLRTHTAGFLRPGEVLYGALPVTLDELAPERIPKRFRRAKPQAEAAARFTGWQRIFLPVAAVMYLAALPAGLVEEGGHRTWRGIRRLFRGRVWQGGWESAAGRFVITARTGPMDRAGHGHQRLALAFTDRRLLLLSRPSEPEREAAQLLGELPRGQYGPRREAHPARHRDRVDLAFADGSWVALAADERAQVPLPAGLLSAD